MEPALKKPLERRKLEKGMFRGLGYGRVVANCTFGLFKIGLAIRGIACFTLVTVLFFCTALRAYTSYKAVRQKHSIVFTKEHLNLFEDHMIIFEVFFKYLIG